MRVASKGWLITTGIVAAIAIAMPQLVLIGAMAFILPGLILGAFPTIFLWSATFAIFRALLRNRVTPWVGSVSALTLAAATLCGIPAILNAVGMARVAVLTAGDTAAPDTLRLAGNVRIERAGVSAWRLDEKDRKSPRLAVVDLLSASLLLVPGIDSVSIVPSPEDRQPNRPEPPLPTRQRLATTCPPDGAEIVRLSQSAFRDGFDNGEALGDAFLFALVDGRCVVREPAQGSTDWTVRLTDGPERVTFDWSLSTTPAWRRVEVIDANGNIRHRHTVTQRRRYPPVLWIAAEGDMMTFRFGWAQNAEPGQSIREQLKYAPEIARFAPFAVKGDPAATAEYTRSAVRSLLANQAIPADRPAFTFSTRFLVSIARTGVAAGDLDLVRAMLGDLRFTNFRDFGGAFGKHDDKGASMRDPIMARMLRSPLPQQQSTLHDLSHALHFLPPGSFETLTPDMEALLNDPSRRFAIATLVERQYERGAAAAPLLAAILVENLTSRDQDHTRRLMAAAARNGLIRIGPAASAQLPAIEKALNFGHTNQISMNTRDWSLLLVRLGRSIDDLPLPKNSPRTIEKYREMVEDTVKRFDTGRWKPDR